MAYLGSRKGEPKGVIPCSSATGKYGGGNMGGNVNARQKEARPNGLPLNTPLVKVVEKLIEKTCERTTQVLSHQVRSRLADISRGVSMSAFFVLYK